MLNTDAHSRQVKVRMTKAEFMKNNRGINDGADVPEEVLSEIYDEIQSNEIRMKDEMDAAIPLPGPGPGLAGALANVGRDLQMEAYVMQTNNMANKTEVDFLSLPGDKILYFVSRHYSKLSCVHNEKDLKGIPNFLVLLMSFMSNLCLKLHGRHFWLVYLDRCSRLKTTR
jgi:Sec7-like guanine-nucleotide exchange factor